MVHDFDIGCRIFHNANPRVSEPKDSRRERRKRRKKERKNKKNRTELWTPTHGVRVRMHVNLGWLLLYQKQSEWSGNNEEVGAEQNESRSKRWTPAGVFRFQIHRVIITLRRSMASIRSVAYFFTGGHRCFRRLLTLLHESFERASGRVLIPRVVNLFTSVSSARGRNRTNVFLP